ncbi:MAG TPA: tRNA (guanosine(46)-N7)-methyltransferase TrmB [Bacteroidia bacterium]|jgi:tRNA (guanine-N7-)-methyltransferase|nr:tRNA (guanosine(46)-N7)-methyltransferase TrmB [Bacteroidia bacterium]
MPSKQEKFVDFNSFPNCFTLYFENISAGLLLKGKWHKEYFKNENPIVLELGCGKGEYSVGLAKNNPDKNYIGVDIKGNRIWTGAKEALDTKLNNVAFLRTRIDFIEHCFAENEVSEIWITFPDPQPQKTRTRKRLTNMMFITRYQKFLKKEGLVHLKTDSTSFYEYTLGVIQENNSTLLFNTDDLYVNCPAGREELTSIKTHYEKLFTDKGEKIKYCCFKIN